MNYRSVFSLFVLVIVFITVPLITYSEELPWDSPKWELRGKEAEFLGQKAFIGSATLKDVEFMDGVVEVDIAFSGERTFAGINFHILSPTDFEEFYMRPHASGLYNALQYASRFNGLTDWQLSHGRGGTAAYEIPANKWMHLKLEVKGSQARIFIDEDKTPALVIDNLEHGAISGKIGLQGAANGSVYFANFKYSEDKNLVFDAPPVKYYPTGIITDWKVSDKHTLDTISREFYPTKKFMDKLKWTDVKSEKTGLVNIGHYITKDPRNTEFVVVKTNIKTEKAGLYKMEFGYSDEIHLCYNGSLLFHGNSAYTYRDPKFAGLIGYYDAVYLNLKEGDNEILAFVTEIFGGWGIMARLEPVSPDLIKTASGITKLWEVKEGLTIPESITFDQKRNCIYVANYYDVKAPGQNKEYISKISADGEIINLRFIDGVNKPTGMTLHNDKLHIVTREMLLIADPDTGKIEKEIKFENPGVANDITVGPDGKIYVTDSLKNQILRSSGEKFEIWLEGGDLNGPNGIAYYKDNIYIGNTRDGCILKIDIKTAKITTIACLPSAVIDGLVFDGDDILTNDFNGILYRIKNNGEIKMELDSSGIQLILADFGYDPETQKIFLPAIYKSGILTYKLSR
ncbi:MAG: hypothetical protein JW737_01850 [Acidobacteria bacterium]|nr:hypothetical protein [Acidobacteriota bacterium]